MMKYSKESLGIQCTTCPVKEICLPKNLTEEQITWLDNIIHEVKIIERGEFLFKTGDKVNHAFALHSGAFKEATLDAAGNEYVNKFYWPGDIVGLEYVDKGTYPFHVAATEKTTVCLLPIELFEHAQYFLYERMFHLLSYKLRELQSYPSTTNAKKRVAIFFLELINRQNNKKYPLTNIPLHVSQIDISHKIGIANETLSRILHEFSKQEILTIKKHCICEYNVSTLKRLVGLN